MRTNTVVREVPSPEVSKVRSAGSYMDAVVAVLRDSAGSELLHHRVVVDDGRDPSETLRDAVLLYELQRRRFAEFTVAGAAVGIAEEQLEAAGLRALARLLTIAEGFSDQGRDVALLLLALYDGTRFPFDFAKLQAFDAALFDDCIAVVRMDARLGRRHVRACLDQVENRQPRWQRLAEDWRVVEVVAHADAASLRAGDGVAQGVATHSSNAVARLPARKR